MKEKERGEGEKEEGRGKKEEGGGERVLYSSLLHTFSLLHLHYLYIINQLICFYTTLTSSLR